jgi:seryl-tRNA synthetase
MPSSNSYREISSCSNVLDYQARGLSIKYFNPATKKNEFAHTLNGTGTSLNRLWIAIVENFQQKDGSIIIPTALRPYLQGQETITKK